jgi:hypothetical protein
MGIPLPKNISWEGSNHLPFGRELSVFSDKREEHPRSSHFQSEAGLVNDNYFGHPSCIFDA